MAIQWHSGMVLGIESMDLTHREFVDQINAFETANDGELSARFPDIVEHTVNHFRREDEWMRRLDYAHAEAHTEEHDKVLKVMAAVARCVDKGDTRFGRILIREVAKWFHEHALSMDYMLAGFLHASGHGPAGPADVGGDAPDSAGR